MAVTLVAVAGTYASASSGKEASRLHETTSKMMVANKRLENALMKFIGDNFVRK